MYDCQVLADSIHDEQRLVTVKVTFPRFILAEVNTHRVFSRNSASSRAIPTERIIERVEDDPFIPETFNKRVKGMGVGEALEGNNVAACRGTWLGARDFAVRQAKILMDLDVDKSRVNRLLEPFMWHTAIISSTEWDNFFALRDHEAAQPEFRILAGLMLDTMRASQPYEKRTHEWHLPFITMEEYNECEQNKIGWEYMAMVSAGRCARVSFDRAHEFEPITESHARAKRLMESGHLSPFEHQARPERLDEHGPNWRTSENHSNFIGWIQFRKSIPYENNFGILEGRRHWDN